MDFIDLLLESNSNVDNSKLKNKFILPIQYQKSCKIIDRNLINDLELNEFKNLDVSNLNINDISSNNIINKNLYYYLFKPENLYEELCINKWNNFYSNDVNYLMDTQNLIENFDTSKFLFNININNNNNNCENNFDTIMKNHDKLALTNNFNDVYDYLSIPFLTQFNNSEVILQFLSIYNLTSPIITFIIPIISLFLPFLIIKLQGHDITFELYKIYLSNLLKNNSLGVLFKDYSNISFSSAIYLIITILLYFFQLYSNYYSCKRYYNNFNFIIKYFDELKAYLKNTIYNMNNFSDYIEKYNTYISFNNELKKNIKILDDYYNKIENIKYYDSNKDNLKNYIKIGYIMKEFYKLYHDKNIIKSLYYSFDFNGYLKNINNIFNLFISKNIGKCSFNKEKTYIKESYYIGLLKDNSNNIIKNNIDLCNNLIISGPNASGKTTILKSSLFNIILSQQIGFGFYQDANINIYDFIHCYINIPDTNDRDSLFQAEARKCKNILDIIKTNNKERHFCIFDEIFSGTNPDDAVNSGLNYLNYINKIENVDYLLTTHYYKLCKKLETNNKNIENLKMKVKGKDKSFNFTYKITNGINKINGGSKILKDLDYPDEIINII